MTQHDDQKEGGGTPSSQAKPEQHQAAQMEVEKLQQSVQQAVETSENVREEVRRITMDALAEGKLDAAQVKSVIEAVIEGASAGMTTHGAKAKAALEEAVQGLEDGLIKAAEASKLALEEAASRTEEFTEQEVKQALDQMLQLERVFVDTLADLAHKGTDQARAVLDDLARHARNSGTSLGEYMSEVMETLPRRLQEAGEWGFKAGVETARATGAHLAAIASGFLAGLADALEKQSNKLKHKKS